MFRRVVAFFIDNTLSALCSYLMIRIVVLPTMPDWVAYTFVLVLFPVLYWVLLPLKFGATPAKKMLKLKIVNADGVSAPSFRTLFVREVIGRFVSGIIFGLGYFWALFTQEQRAWHDKIAGTRVVSTKEIKN